MQVKLGCGQITWRGVAREEAMDDIRRAGYLGAPWGGRQEQSPEEIKAFFDRFDLVPAPSYMSGQFWNPDHRSDLLASAERYAKTSKALGVTEVYVADGGFNEPSPSGRTRKQVVSHVGPEDSLTDQQFKQLTDTLQAVGETMLEHGVRACFHNHGGTFIETEAEIERLLAGTDPEVVFLGPDTGHLAWGGVDVVEFTRRHASRIKTMHLKDVDYSVRDEGAAAGWDYGTFEEHAIWAEIGEGGVDFATVFQLLDSASFDGWLIVETDVTQKSTPLASAVISRENLRKLGI